MLSSLLAVAVSANQPAGLVDTPRRRKKELKQTKQLESLKRGLDWEISQFEMSLNEFSKASGRSDVGGGSATDQPAND